MISRFSANRSEKSPHPGLGTTKLEHATDADKCLRLNHMRVWPREAGLFLKDVGRVTPSLLCCAAFYR